MDLQLNAQSKKTLENLRLEINVQIQSLNGKKTQFYWKYMTESVTLLYNVYGINDGKK